MADDENEFNIGEPIVFGFTFTDEILGTAKDPDTVKIGIQLGSGTPQFFSLSDLVRTALGAWYLLYQTTNQSPGDYSIQVSSTGALIGMSDPAVFTLLSAMAGLP